MVQIANPNGRFITNNGAAPCEGTLAYPFILDFSIATAYLIDMTAQFQNKEFTTLQTAWVDNSLNQSTTQIIIPGTGQVIDVPAFSQGFFAMLEPNPPKLSIQTTGTVTVQVILLNFYIPPQVWAIQKFSAGGLPQIDIPAIDAIISGGALNVNAGPFTIQGVTDASGTITAGGTRQLVIPAGAARKRWLLANPSTATEVLQFSLGTNTAGLVDLTPGMIWDESGSSIVGDAVYVVAPTTGHAFTAYWE